MLTGGQIFVGTPQASASDSWKQIISKITLTSSAKIPDTWFPEHIGKCAKYHEDLSETFDSSIGNHEILNCYEMSDSSKDHTVVGVFLIYPL